MFGARKLIANRGLHETNRCGFPWQLVGKTHSVHKALRALGRFCSAMLGSASDEPRQPGREKKPATTQAEMRAPQYVACKAGPVAKAQV